ncbi:hypothetical protein SAMN05192558_12216 [Actinokineospora alba]|uniref:Uncharacterized protein n=2 Tax=Actinokineospora alba TaxID=504798 RepID=A0A1H0WIT0_9PSEU|nr:hypothetical protein C8E96_0863 [Actinokineospora alba]SDH60911.1 hypothetical protein SAMN05421871_101684 [Actinokineospora alba]SDP90634.1 hypothetical protein SAMN05192558_12216 [Actinokineospora alba]
MAFAQEIANGYISLDFGVYFDGKMPSVPLWAEMSLDLVSQRKQTDWISVNLGKKPRIQRGNLHFEGILTGMGNHVDTVWRAYFELDH